MPRIVCSSLAVSGVFGFFIDCNLFPLAGYPVGYVVPVELNLYLTEMQLATAQAIGVATEGRGIWSSFEVGGESILSPHFSMPKNQYVTHHSVSVLQSELEN